jgi:hypothetical protein
MEDNTITFISSVSLTLALLHEKATPFSVHLYPSLFSLYTLNLSAVLLFDCIFKSRGNEIGRSAHPNARQ